jgi:hypothetical protein
MPYNTPPHQTERQRSIVEDYFLDAMDALRALPTSQQFQTFCDKRQPGLIPDRFNPAYWKLVADYAYVASEAGFQAGVDRRLLVARELVAAAPDNILQRTKIGDTKPRLPLSLEEYDASRTRLCYFNRLVANAAEWFDDLSVPDLTWPLVRAVEDSIGRRRSTLPRMWRIMRGVQRERAFVQQLDYTRRPYSRSSIPEDLSGVDFLVHDYRGGTMAVDVTTPLIRGKGAQPRPYFFIGTNMRVVIPSLFSDEDFEDRFFVPDWLAAERTPELMDILEQASLRLRTTSPYGW